MKWIILHFITHSHLECTSSQMILYKETEPDATALAFSFGNLWPGKEKISWIIVSISMNSGKSSCARQFPILHQHNGPSNGEPLTNYSKRIGSQSSCFSISVLDAWTIASSIGSGKISLDNLLCDDTSPP